MGHPTPDEQRYHWGEGNKYALEAMKALLWLNGAAAAALLTFFGGARPHLITSGFGSAIASFGTGAALSVVLFICAYAAQLSYGNRGINRFGQLLHNVAYIPLVGSLLAFLIGIYFAYGAIIQSVGS